MTLFNRAKKKIDQAKAYFGQKKWDLPVLKSDEKNQLHDKIIHRGDEMVNAIEIKSDKWESELKHYYPAEAYYKYGPIEYLKSKSGNITIKPGTKKYYQANARGTVGRYRRKAKLQPIYTLNRIQQADRIQQLRDQNYQLKFNLYQKLLENPLTNHDAVEELRFLKALFQDTQQLNSQALQQKLARAQLASKSLGFLGMALGSAVGFTGLNTLTSKASDITQSLTDKLTNLLQTIGSKIGQIENAEYILNLLNNLKGVQTQEHINLQKMKELNIESLKTTFSTAKEVAAQTASLIVLGAAANLTIPGATITAIVIVTMVAKGAVNIYSHRLEKKEMAIQMNKDQLLATIDEMIQNNGTVFYKENNPMFANAKIIKDQIDKLLNSVENDKVIEAIGSLEGPNSATAAALLDEMITNAHNTKNSDFETELEKFKTLERMNNTTLNKLRNRRAKLKRLHNTYKKSKINANLQNIISKNSNINVTSKRNNIPATRKRKY